jgi:hypothetical protein
MERMNEYRTLGRTGLKVSPLGLGVMTYGWGADKQAGRAMFDLYRERGGNFFDTADVYTGGQSETWLGEPARGVARRGRHRHSPSFNAQAGNLNAGATAARTSFARRRSPGACDRLRRSVHSPRLGSGDAGGRGDEHAERSGAGGEGGTSG